MSTLIGVPQGGLLGPLFFFLVINNLALIINFMCKLFADDTTLGNFDKDLDTLIKTFADKLKVLLVR